MRRACALLAFALGPGLLAAQGLKPPRADRAVEEAGALFRAGDLSGAARALEPWAFRDPRAGRERLAALFLLQDLEAVEAQARALPPGRLDPEARLWAARAAAGRADWAACLRHLDQLPAPEGPWALALRAEALQALAAPGAEQARQRALSATAGTRLAAATALWAGEVAEAQGDTAAAESLYKRAEAADPAYSMVHARLARLYQAQGRVRDARIRLERARRVDPGDEGLREALNILLAEAPGEQRALDREAAQAKDRFLARANPAVAPRPALEGEPLVRVGLLQDAPAFTLVLGGAYVEDASGRTLAAGTAWRVGLAPGGGWQMAPLSPGAEAALRFGRPLRLRPLDEGSTFGLHAVDHGAGYFWASREDRYYRGLAELRPQGAQGLTLVNELGLEAYLLSVVPSEIRPQWPEEALKAQAIAARTEAWRSLGRFAARGYDLCPTVLCAVYSGVGVEHARTTHAVTATAGLVLEDARGRLAPTFYMHNSGGHTQEPGEAWGGSTLEYPSMAVLDAPKGSALARHFPVTPAGLLAFLDDSDPSAPAWARGPGSTWRWTLRLSAAELEASVRRRHPGVPPLRQVLPLQRTVGGYVRRVRFSGAADGVGSSDFIRTAIRGLKSNLFYVEPRLGPDGTPAAFLFHGGGWGHGVGLSQAGARAMAQAGHGAEAILTHYFGSERLRRRYGP